VTKSSSAFRTIGEAALQTGVSARTLRDWELKFPELEPLKRAGGRRYYDPDAIALIGAIHALITVRGLTVRGVQLLLSERGSKGVIDEAESSSSASPQPPSAPHRSHPEGLASRPVGTHATKHLQDALARLESAKTGLQRARR